MATVTRTLFSVVKTAWYDDVLNNPALGSLSTRTAYGSTFSSLGEALNFPWRLPSPHGHWSQMWSYYLRSPTYLQPAANASLTAERAWDFVVPFELSDSVSISRIDGTSGHVRRLLYPAAVVVIASVEVPAQENLESLAHSISQVRHAEDWDIGVGVYDRTLDGIMGECRDNAAEFLFKGNVPEHSGETSYSVAAPASGTIEETLLDIEIPEIAATVAGLATLSPPGIFEASRLVEANHDARWDTRLYVTRKGHTLWNKSRLSGGGSTSKDTMGCLMRNHVDLIAHVDACLPTVAWAASRVARNSIFASEGAAIVGPAAIRLLSLHAGGEKTYSSEVAKRRIEPRLAEIKRASSGL